MTKQEHIQLPQRRLRDNLKHFLIGDMERQRCSLALDGKSCLLHNRFEAEKVLELRLARKPLFKNLLELISEEWNSRTVNLIDYHLEVHVHVENKTIHSHFHSSKWETKRLVDVCGSKPIFFFLFRCFFLSDKMM